MKNVCVFCGASFGRDPVYREAATAFGKALAERHLGLVYGGGHVGLMGVLADAALAGGAPVHGVIPRHLEGKEIAHKGLTQLHVVDGMHARKALMADLSDAFVALPGGAGTLDETFEQWTWLQLGFHAKPVAFLNVGGFYDGLRVFIDHAVDQGFIRKEHRDAVTFTSTIEGVFDALNRYKAPAARWG
jgi:uncharacterized protein (TIGR00730 family)